jgi:energy-coupling factor transporter ATP-binding protein EcfA2
MNVIAGENNVGKTALLQALELLIGLPTGPLPTDYWPNSNPTRPLTLGLRMRLDNEQIEAIANNLRIYAGRSEMSGKSFADRFGVDIEAQGTWTGPNVNPSLKAHFVHFVQDEGRHTAEINLDYPNYQDNYVPPRLGGQVYGELVRVLRESFLSFPEFRLRPQATGSEVLRSPEGINAASALFLLKVGIKQQQERYRRIQAYFTKLFPALKFDLNKPPGQAPRILVEKVQTGHELPVENIGAGIVEMLIILTHIVGEQNKVFTLDSPELHLHPHSQRLLSRFLKESSSQNQIILATHSPYFVDLNDVEHVILVRDLGDTSVSTQLPERYFKEDEKKILSKNLRYEEKEFLFSRRVLLVEGQTEYGALPVIARKLGKDFDEYGVSVVSVGGNYFGLMMKILGGFALPWKAICDSDTLINITRKITIGGVQYPTSILFYALNRAGLKTEEVSKIVAECSKSIVPKGDPRTKTRSYDESLFGILEESIHQFGVYVMFPDFEGYLRNHGAEKLFEEAEEIYGSNKVLQSRHVA